MQRDREFWAALVPHFRDFWFGNLLPARTALARHYELCAAVGSVDNKASAGVNNKEEEGNLDQGFQDQGLAAVAAGGNSSGISSESTEISTVPIISALSTSVAGMGSADAKALKSLHRLQTKDRVDKLKEVVR